MTSRCVSGPSRTDAAWGSLNYHTNSETFFRLAAYFLQVGVVDNEAIERITSRLYLYESTMCNSAWARSRQSPLDFCLPPPSPRTYSCLFRSSLHPLCTQFLDKIFVLHHDVRYCDSLEDAASVQPYGHVMSYLRQRSITRQSTLKSCKRGQPSMYQLNIDNR